MTSDLAVNPATGEILEHLDQQPAVMLAEALAAIRDQQAQISTWGRALEDELRRRLKAQDRTIATFGRFEVSAKPARRSVWDVELFETELERLVAAGQIKAGEVTEVIKRETSVRAGEAGKLIARLDGEPKAALEQARTWQTDTAKVTVTHLERTPEQAPPVLDHADRGKGVEPTAEAPATPAQTPPTTPPTLDPKELFA